MFHGWGRWGQVPVAVDLGLVNREAYTKDGDPYEQLHHVGGRSGHGTRDLLCVSVLLRTARQSGNVLQPQLLALLL